MPKLFSSPLGWLFTGLGVLIVAMTAFVVFQPVKVVPRLGEGPDYALVDQQGAPVTPARMEGKFVLLGFGYLHDPTGALEETVADLRRVEAALAGDELAEDVVLALVLFDPARDTLEARQAFAAAQGLTGDQWLVVSGEEASLKRMIGQGFGIYYEPVPMADLIARQPELADRLEGPPADEDYGYLQAERLMLVDERNLIRGEYRMPLDVETALRDLRLMDRERNSSGASRAVNEAAHLFLCYP